MQNCLRAVMTLRAILTVVQFWPSVQNWQSCNFDPLCKIVFVQFCALVHFCLRAILDPCILVPSCSFDPARQKWPFVQMCPRANSCTHKILYFSANVAATQLKLFCSRYDVILHHYRCVFWACYWLLVLKKGIENSFNT